MAQWTINTNTSADIKYWDEVWRETFDNAYKDAVGMIDDERKKLIEELNKMSTSLSGDEVEALKMKARAKRSKLLKKGDKVSTPKGSGSIECIDRDGTVVVDLDDSDHVVLHEFTKAEVKKV